ncbi:MAG: DNA repair protein RecN [Gammaproteobacteria bacterium]|nr:MAG: DNA repair protein RecN [Gammaproteobacteria bacterium]RLA37537.1 MAG: DNA repair protein RecN [Gammaproteobacteria bacterium]
MLTSLQVRNFAIIDQVEVEFSPGMTVLTGETGAGKSILVDALGLVLGERGGGGLVRTGTKRAEFTAEFDLQNLPGARHWLEEQMLDLDDECNLRRVINADGRSRAFINGNSVPQQSLKTLGEMLLDIHGQHFHQSLGHKSVQRDLLDYFGGLVDLAVATATAFSDWQDLAKQLGDLASANADRVARLELLRFQINELDALDLGPDEIIELSQERLKLQNSGRLAEGVHQALQRIYDGDPTNAQSLLADATRTVDSLSGVDESLQPALNLLQDANIQISETVDLLRRYADDLDMDPARQNWVEERLDAIATIARKHHIEPEEIDPLHQRLKVQLNDLEHAEERGAELEESTRQAESIYRKSARRLSTGRKKAAAAFSTAVTDAMSNLGMPGGVFVARVSSRDINDPRPWGLDDVEYQISANPGQDPQPLSRVASGGELSRMSLAIQVIASDGSAIPTMVFDEVDSGVGGGVAEMVGLRLRELGQTRQVFCVTHLPQVASLASNHFRIMKITDGKSTKTGITQLGEDERVEELARMLGGVEITKRTREHAAEMLRAGMRADKKIKRA